MKLSKICKYIVRVREFETVQIEVGAEISHFDLGYDDQSWAELTTRDQETKKLRDLLNTEVDRLAREELETIADWSEISPNLAEDYLSIQPPAPLQRNRNAKKTDTHAPSSRRLRRGAPTSPPSRPVRS